LPVYKNRDEHESHLRDLVRDVVVLRESNLTTNAHPPSRTLRRGRRI